MLCFLRVRERLSKPRKAQYGKLGDAELDIPQFRGVVGAILWAGG